MWIRPNKGEIRGKQNVIHIYFIIKSNLNCHATVDISIDAQIFVFFYVLILLLLAIKKKFGFFAFHSIISFSV